MATSGKINGSPAQSYPGLYAYWADWKLNSSSIDKNTSNITVWLRLQRVDGANAGAYNLADKPSVSLSVGGSAKTPSIAYIDTRNKVECTFATWTGDVKHNADGTLNCPISASFTHYGSSTLTGGSLSGTAVLDTIPQATTIDSVTCNSSYFTGKITYKYTPKTEVLHTRCAIQIGGTTVRTIDIGSKSAEQHTGDVTFIDSELQTIYGKVTSNPAKGTLVFSFKTYSDSGYKTQVGEEKTYPIELYVPQDASTKPSVSASVKAVSSLPSTFAGLYIQGKTKVEATLSTSPKFGASITTKGVTVGGKACSVSGNVYTSEFLQNAGTVEVVGSATDTRGFTNSATQPIEVIAYNNPKVSGVSVKRSENGKEEESGTSLLITATRGYDKVKVGNTQKNFCELQYRVKRSGGDYGDWKTLLAKTASGDTVKVEVEKNAISVENTYVVQVRAIDDMGFASAESTNSVPTDKVYMHRTQNAMGLGKYAETDGLDIAWNVQMNGNRVTGLPTPTGDTDAVPLGYNDPRYAPSGYGLGGGSKWLIGTGVDLNDVTDNGWYVFNSGGNAHSPFSTGSMLVVNRAEDGNFCHQIAFMDSGTGSSIQIRRRTSGNWQAWRAWAPEDFASADHKHMEKIWENATKGGDFPAQTLQLNLSGYSHIIITSTVGAYPDTGFASSGLVDNVVNAVGYLSTFATDFWMHTRHFIIKSDGIEFGGGYMKNTANGAVYENWANRTVPVAIYGIRGV